MPEVEEVQEEVAPKKKKTKVGTNLGVYIMYVPCSGAFACINYSCSFICYAAPKNGHNARLDHHEIVQFCLFELCEKSDAGS